MKIKYQLIDDYAADEIGICMHPKNHGLISTIEKNLETKYLEVIDPKNSRQSKLRIEDVLVIEAMDNLSKLYTTDKDVFYLKGRLKNLEYLTKYGILRISNSVMINLDKIVSFKNGKYARLEVYTTNEESFVVSRHFGKKIREYLR